MPTPRITALRRELRALLPARSRVHRGNSACSNISLSTAVSVWAHARADQGGKSFSGYVEALIRADAHQVAAARKAAA